MLFNDLWAILISILCKYSPQLALKYNHNFLLFLRDTKNWNYFEIKCKENIYDWFFYRRNRSTLEGGSFHLVLSSNFRFNLITYTGFLSAQTLLSLVSPACRESKALAFTIEHCAAETQYFLYIQPLASSIIRSRTLSICSVTGIEAEQREQKIHISSRHRVYLFRAATAFWVDSFY